MSRRAVAAITAIWLIACGTLAARHEARAAHYVDAHGQAFHASKMNGEHTTSQSDVHARDSAPDHDACSLVVAHLVAFDRTSAVVATAASTPHSITRPLVPTLASVSVLAIAPKTSPPRNA